METGKIVKLLREAEGLSQADLADKLKATRSYLSMIENGRKKPANAFLKRLSHELRVPMILLLAGDDAVTKSGEISEGESELLEKIQALLGDIVAEKIRNRVLLSS